MKALSRFLRVILFSLTAVLTGILGIFSQVHTSSQHTQPSPT